MSHFIPVASISIPTNRQRREFSPDALLELCESIQWGPAGLQHAVVVRPGPEQNQFILVSGERRLRAVNDIYALNGKFNYSGEPVPSGCIPCNLLGELSVLEAWEAELDENIRRADLTWQEQASATANLAALRKAQAQASGLPAPTTQDIAEEVRGQRGGSYGDATRKEIIVSQYLGNEKVQRAKSVDEAFKIIKREEQTRRLEEAAETIGKTFSTSNHKLFHEDAVEWLKAYKGEPFQIILTDPPYGMGADTFGDSGMGEGGAAGAHGYKDDWATAERCISTILVEGFRITAPQAHLYMFCDFDRFHTIKGMAESAGWKVFRTPLIWAKPSAFRAPWPEQGPQRHYETILYAVKGDKRVNYLAGDVLLYPSDDNLGHAAQKPVKLLADLLGRSCTPGDRVLDPFCGSGSVFDAAHACLCYAVGIEQADYAYGIATERLKGLA
jgi:DNA modification methylase